MGPGKERWRRKKRFPTTSDWNYWKVVVVHIYFSDYRMTSVLAARDTDKGFI